MNSNFYSYEGKKPIVSKDSYIHPMATIIGEVVIEEGVYIGPGAVVRGDWGPIIIKKNSNVQENCIVHVYPKVEVVLEEYSHVGHGAIIHGAILKKNTLIGMNSVIMDNSIIEENCIVGAMSFVPNNFRCEKNKLIVGSPAKVIKDLKPEMIEWKKEGTEYYIKLAREAKDILKACNPKIK